MGTHRRNACRRCGTITCALLVLLVFTSLGSLAQIPVLPPSADPAPGQVLNVAVHPLSRENTTHVDEKVPLLEVFTATWCPPCRPADAAVERLMSERSPGLAKNANETEAITLGLLSYHPFPDIGGEDPFGIPEGHTRLEQKHDAFWFPSAYVDGLLEDAPQTRSIAVDVGMEEIMHGSYKRLIERADAQEVPFTLNVTSARTGDDPVTWDVEVILTARRAIDTPLFLQPALWEDHVHFLGSNEVDEHRMVVRAMAPRSETPGRLEAGEVLQETFQIVAPEPVDPENAGVTIIIEAPWGQERDERAGLFFGFALAVAGGTAVTAAWTVHTKNQDRKQVGKGGKEGKGGKDGKDPRTDDLREEAQKGPDGPDPKENAP